MAVRRARSEAETEVFIIKRTCSYGYKERIVQLEEENRNLQGMLDETNHALALQALATAACGATENAIISPAADDFSCFFVRVKK